jgi:hypothetical protein
MALATTTLAVPVARAQAPSLSAHAAREEVSVGEVFTVELRGAGPAGVEWIFPDQAGTDDVELTREPLPSPAPDASPPPTPPPGVARYRAAVFAVKDVAIPPVTARWRLPDGSSGEATSAALPLRLVSLLPKAEQERTLADVHAPLPLTVGWPFWAALGALVLLVVGLASWFARRRRPGAAVTAPAPEIEPDDEALQALAALAASGHLTRAEYRPFYIALAEVIKRYLERRLDAPVLEMTSTETLAFLRGHPHGDALHGVVRDLVGAADQVKFARGAAQAEEAARHLDAARALVQGLEARLRAAREAQAADAAHAAGARR